MSHLVWIYAICKSLLSPMVVRELNRQRGDRNGQEVQSSLCIGLAGAVILVSICLRTQ